MNLWPNVLEHLSFGKVCGFNTAAVQFGAFALRAKLEKVEISL